MNLTDKDFKVTLMNVLKRLKEKCHIDNRRSRKPPKEKKKFFNGNLKTEIENSLGGLNDRLKLSKDSINF